MKPAFRVIAPSGENLLLFFLDRLLRSDRPRHWVVFAVHNSLLQVLKQPVPHSPRLMSLRLHCKDISITVISAYAPTLVADNEDEDDFYRLHEEIVQNIPSSDSLFILGDFNARVGSNSAAWVNVVGQHGTGNRNENGQRLLKFYARHSLCTPNTFFAGWTSSKVTWMHPRSKRWHQLDHILAQRKHLSHCRSLPSSDCNSSDHCLVHNKLKLLPKKIHTARSKSKLISMDTTSTNVSDHVENFQ